jgi:hypothetical protein
VVASHELCVEISRRSAVLLPTAASPIFSADDFQCFTLTSRPFIGLRKVNRIHHSVP